MQPLQPLSFANFGTNDQLQGTTNMQGFNMNLGNFGVPPVQPQNMMIPQMLNSQNAMPTAMNLQQADPMSIRHSQQLGAFGVGSNQTTSNGMFGMESPELINFGLGAAQLGAGIYYQNKQLGLAQQGLDQSKQAYTDMRADKAAIETANTERSQAAAIEKQQRGIV